MTTMAATTTLGLVLALAALAAAKQPRLETKDGHVYITTGESTQNVTDLLSITKAGPLFKDQEGKLDELGRAQEGKLTELKNAVTGQIRSVNRRSTNNTKSVTDLLEELTSQGKASLEVNVAFNAAIVAQVKRLADAADAEKTSTGGGTPTKAAGAAFNPFAASFSSLGGDTLRVTFPKGAELIADPRVKMYQCKFTYIKDKKLDTTKTRTSAAVAAETERTFSCVVPAWADKSNMPEDPNFTTNFEVLENSRSMPAPSGGQVVKWTPEIPSLKFGTNPLSISGEAGKANKFSVDLSVLYAYGEVGYQDVRFSAATDKAWGSIITQIKFSGATTSAKRKMEFSVTHPTSAKKEATYWIDVTISSAKFKLSTKHRLNVGFKVSTAIGTGGTNGVLTKGQMSQLYQRLGSTNLELCFNPKLHGFSSHTMHTRCDNRGKTLTLMRRNSNGKVFGGVVLQNLNKDSRWVHDANPTPWLFTVTSGNVKFFNYRSGRRHTYYMNSGYGMTWGGGHDLYCNSDFTSCNANPYSFWHNSGEMAGTQNWKHKNEGGSHGMVYEVFLIK